MTYTREGLVKAANDAGFPEVTLRTVAHWVDLGLLPKSQLVGRGKGGGRGAVRYWSDDEAQMFLWILAQHRVNRHIGVTATFPVASWLYWGDEYTQLPQLRRALQTWWSRTGRYSHASAVRMGKQAAGFLTPAKGSRQARKEFGELITTSIDTGKFPKEEIVARLVELRSRNPNDGMIGEYRVPPVLLVYHMFSNIVAMEAIEKDGEREGDESHVTDDMFEDARNGVNQECWERLATWQRTLQGDTDVLPMEEPTVQYFFDSACKELLLYIGMQILMDQHGHPAPPHAPIIPLAASGVFHGTAPFNASLTETNVM